MKRSLPRRPGARPAALALLLATAAAAAQQWKELGPAPIVNGGYTGRISAIACSPTDSNKYFVAGADGGVWRTTNGGATWQPLTDAMATTAIGALAIDPSDENTIYAGTGEANFANHSRFGLGLYKSTDGGGTWTHLAESTFAGRCFSSIAVNPQNPQQLFAGITGAGGFPALAAAKGHPQAGGPYGVFRSDDGGATWTHLTNGVPALAATDVKLDPAAPATVYAAIGHIFGSPQNGVYKSVDGGASFSKLAGGLPTSNVGRISIAVAPSQPGRLYALIANAATASGGNGGTLGAFRSDNFGASWSSIPVGSIQATYGWYLCVVSVRPGDPNTAIFGGLDLVRTTNGGGSFSVITPPHVDLHAIAWDAAGRLLVGDDGGVHRSTTLGSSWESLNVGLGVTQFYAGVSTHPTNDLVLYGGFQDNGSNRRTTDTLNWTQINGGDGGWTQLDQASPNRVFTEFQGTGNLYLSSDGGNSFSYSGSGISAGDRNCFLPPFLIDPTNSQRMYYGTHRVYRSLNGGASWTAVSGDLSNGSGAIRSLALAPSDPNVVYAVTNDGNVQVSTNAGANFTLIAGGVPGWPRVTRQLFVMPDDPQTVYLAASGFGTDQVRRSTNGGQTWQPLDGDLPDVPVNVLAAENRSNSPVIYAGTESGLYRSIDGGASWRKYGAGLPNTCIVDLALELPRARLIATTQGRGAWSVPASVLGDVNFDCVVDQSDLGMLLATYLLSAGQPGFIPAADFTGDGKVDQADLGILLAAYGLTCD